MPIRNSFLLIAVALTTACFAQNLEIGGAGGFGVTRGLSVANSSGSADAGLRNGPTFSAVVTHHMYRLISGEVRYSYRQGDLRLASGGTQATLGAEAHSLHYDFLFFARERGNRLRPFAAAGGGVRYYRGTGTEVAVQPLSSFALLTKTSQYRGLLSLGGGVEIEAAPHVALRVEFRDYITQRPDRLIAPVTGATLKGVFHDLTPMIGLSFAL